LGIKVNKTRKNLRDGDTKKLGYFAANAAAYEMIDKFYLILADCNN